MTLGLLQIVLLLWTAFAVTVSVSNAFVAPRLDPMLARLAPPLRAAILRGLLVAPVVGGALATFVCFLPKLAGIVAPRLDHCLAHADHHVHFCPNHPPDALFGPAFWAVSGGLALVVGTIVTRRIVTLHSARNEARALMRTAEHDRVGDFWVLPTEEAVALSVGFGDRRTLVSAGLRDRVDDEALQVILAHEQAHRQRRDGFWRAAVGLLSWAHWPAVARRLEAELDVACEQACDERAARVVGDRLSVATTILTVARLRAAGGAVQPAMLAFDAPRLDARVRALVDDRAHIGLGPAGAWLLLLTLMGSLLVVADPLHHGLETLLHVLAR